MSMKQMGCEHENRVLRAMRSGKWSAELRQHAAGCADCSEAMRLLATVFAHRSDVTLAAFGWRLDDLPDGPCYRPEKGAPPR